MRTTVRDVIAALTAPAGRLAQTVDELLFGDPDAPVTGIVTAFMPTQQVLEEAHAAGANLVIAHEGPFFSHHAAFAQTIGDDPVYRAKRDFILEAGLAVYRLHDHIHRYRPDGIMEGLIEALDWKRFKIRHLPAAAVIEREETTVRAVAGLLVGAAALAVVAIPAQSMRLGLPDGSAEDPDSTQYRTYQIVAEQFGEGVNGPLLVTATLPDRATDQLERLEAQARVARLIAEQEDVVAVAPVAESSDGTMLVFQVVPAEGPTSVSTEQLVRALRALSPLPDGTALGVAGQATGNIDISQMLADALPGYLALVVGLSALIMLVVFRSLLVPVIATLGFVLSLFATYGALVAVYQWGWLGTVFGVHDPGPILNFLPVLLVGILFGLAMDYQLFLASGMREAYVHGTPARPAVVAGLRAGRAVVTAAGIIMVAVFSGFIFSELTVARPLGFGLAFGVLADAFVVRMLVIPALLHLLGPAAWWLPRWLDRVLPRVDVEGAALRARVPEDARSVVEREPVGAASGAARPS